MTTSTSNGQETVLTGLKRMIQTMPPPTTGTGCGRVECRRRDGKGGVVFWLDQLRGDESPAAHLAYLLASSPNTWPKDGWILTMDGLTCPVCGYQNLPQRSPMVEQDQQGTIYCQSCGRITRIVPTVSRADGPQS